jgi:UDP-N-acetylglucosamine--N-acetylmuramyl-(pentapeptide) pyrophosphoryl-undecaprenol N-acetylglucosamine transferase
MARLLDRDDLLTVVVSGGGTGGHIFPAQTVARILSQQHGVRVTWVGAAGSREQAAAAEAGVPFVAVATGKLRRAANPLKMITAANVRDMVRVPVGVVQATVLLARTRPSVVVTTGGFVAVPVGIAARVTGRPLVVHEQTVRLGLANRVLARGRARVAASAEPTLELLPRRVRARAVLTGNPVRPELADGVADKAIAELGLSGFDRSLPTLYVTGGAQGARQINTLISQLLSWLLDGRANVIHQCGEADLPTLSAQAEKLPADLRARYFLAPFIGPQLADVFALADVVVSRAGAGTIAEITALGKASLLIPLPGSAGREQEHNARHLLQAGAAAALLEREVTAQALRGDLEPLLRDAAAREQMADRARQIGQPQAADRLVKLVLQTAGRAPERLIGR